MLREETLSAGALLVADEIKTVCRLAIGGGCERYGIRPDLVVIGKAIANGFPLAAVGGRADVMDAVSRTWISSTLATEFVSLAAARATLAAMVRGAGSGAPHPGGHPAPRGACRRWPRAHHGARWLAPRACPRCASWSTATSRSPGGSRLACAERGLLFKRSAYNFVSLAHDEAIVDRTLGILDEALSVVGEAEERRSS